MIKSEQPRSRYTECVKHEPPPHALQKHWILFSPPIRGENIFQSFIHIQLNFELNIPEQPLCLKKEKQKGENSVYFITTAD